MQRHARNSKHSYAGKVDMIKIPMNAQFFYEFKLTINLPPVRFIISVFYNLLMRSPFLIFYKNAENIKLVSILEVVALWGDMHCFSGRSGILVTYLCLYLDLNTFCNKNDQKCHNICYFFVKNNIDLLNFSLKKSMNFNTEFCRVWWCFIYSRIM